MTSILGMLQSGYRMSQKMSRALTRSCLSPLHSCDAGLEQRRRIGLLGGEIVALRNIC